MPSKLVFRSPTAEDGAAVFNLINSCPPLDTNSMYCNLLQCSHFADTCVAVVEEQNLVGFVSGYIVPGQPNRLFIWQVAVAEKARGRGLAGKMIEHLLARDYCNGVEFIETTITASNKASWALFEGLATRYQTDINRSVKFDGARHFNGEHDTEMQALIGPFKH